MVRVNVFEVGLSKGRPKKTKVYHVTKTHVIIISRGSSHINSVPTFFLESFRTLLKSPTIAHGRL